MFIPTKSYVINNYLAIKTLMTNPFKLMLGYKMNKTHFLLLDNKIKWYYKTANIDRKVKNDFNTVCFPFRKIVDVKI